MEWVLSADWPRMPDHPSAEDSGWIRCSADSAFVELFGDAMQLAQDPSRPQGFIVRMTQALAWVLHFVHLPPALDRRYSLQRFTLSPAFIELVAKRAIRAISCWHQRVQHCWNILMYATKTSGRSANIGMN